MPPQTERTFQDRTFGTEKAVVSRKSSHHRVTQLDSSTVGTCVESNRQAARTTISIERRSPELRIGSFSSPITRRPDVVDSIGSGKRQQGRIFSSAFCFERSLTDRIDSLRQLRLRQFVHVGP